MNINRAIIAGRLTAKPELKVTPSGVSIATFSLATNSAYTKDGVKQEQVEFHNIVVFGKQAESSSEFLTKGQIALVEGRIQTRNWTSDDGVKHYRTDIIAERVQFGPRAGKSADDTTAKPVAAAKPAEPKGRAAIKYPEEEINPDDIPF